MGLCVAFFSAVLDGMFLAQLAIFRRFRNKDKQATEREAASQSPSNAHKTKLKHFTGKGDQHLICQICAVSIHEEAHFRFALQFASWI